MDFMAQGGHHTNTGNGGTSIWVFPKIGVVPPNHPFVHRVFHYKPSILGYPYFWKHPYMMVISYTTCKRIGEMASHSHERLGLSWPRKLFATELGSGDRHIRTHYGVLGVGIGYFPQLSIASSRSSR